MQKGAYSNRQKKGNEVRVMLTTKDIEFLDYKSKLLRKRIIEMTFQAQSGHPGGSFSISHILAVLYFKVLRYKANEPKWQERDRVVLSKGHAAPGLYAALSEAGFFSVEELKNLRKINCLLQGHPCMHIPGVDITTGSLGLGLSASCGICLGAKMTKRNMVHVYTILGDGELGEGQNWEAAMAAAHFKLNNLTAIIDRNRYQNDAETKEVMELEPLEDKWKSFGWNTIEIDGHCIKEIFDAIEYSKAEEQKPTIIIANTIKGCGASYMIDRPKLHYTAAN